MRQLLISICGWYRQARTFGTRRSGAGPSFYVIDWGKTTVVRKVIMASRLDY